MMRLFVAIDIDDAARGKVIALQKKLTARLGGARHDLRWTRPEQLHLTLAFIAEASETSAAAIVEALTPPIDQSPYPLVLGGLGVFPPEGAPRVLWLGSLSGAHETIAVQRAVAERLTRVGVDAERRPFHAHLTLGRWRDARPALRRAVVEMADTGEIARTPVDHATLYQSRLSPEGSSYTVLVRTPLQK